MSAYDSGHRLPCQAADDFEKQYNQHHNSDCCPCEIRPATVACQFREKTGDQPGGGERSWKRPHDPWRAGNFHNLIIVGVATLVLSEIKHLALLSGRALLLTQNSATRQRRARESSAVTRRNITLISVNSPDHE
jgi:hypothetical protein